MRIYSRNIHYKAAYYAKHGEKHGLIAHGPGGSHSNKALGCLANELKFVLFARIRRLTGKPYRAGPDSHTKTVQYAHSVGWCAIFLLTLLRFLRKGSRERLTPYYI